MCGEVTPRELEGPLRLRSVGVPISVPTRPTRAELDETPVNTAQPRTQTPRHVRSSFGTRANSAKSTRGGLGVRRSGVRISPARPTNPRWNIAPRDIEGSTHSCTTCGRRSRSGLHAHPVGVAVSIPSVRLWRWHRVEPLQVRGLTDPRPATARSRASRGSARIAASWGSTSDPMTCAVVLGSGSRPRAVYPSERFGAPGEERSPQISARS